MNNIRFNFPIASYFNLRSWGARVCLLSLVFLPASSNSLSAAPVKESPRNLLFDFEQGTLAENWTSMSGAEMSLAEVKSLKSEKPKEVQGQCLHIKAGRGGIVYCKPGKVPEKWSDFETVNFYVHRPEEQKGKPLAFEVWAMDADGKGRLWRSVQVEAVGWEKISLPLRFFGPGFERLLTWEGIKRLGFHFPEGGEISLDTISLERKESGSKANLSLKELSRLAFPDAENSVVKAKKGFWLLSDVEDVDFKPLIKDMQKAKETVEEWLPLNKKPLVPPVLIVFSDKEAYREFTPRFAAAFKREAAPPKSDGYTLLGLATGAWDPKQGLRRPTFLHEFIHSLVERELLLPNKSEWFQEAVANLIQIRFRPQAGIEEMIRKAVDNPSSQVPLKELCSGRPVNIGNYWQTLTLMDMILAKKAYREKLPALVEAFKAAGSTDLGPHLGPILGTDWDKLTEEWKNFCRTHYTDKK